VPNEQLQDTSSKAFSNRTPLMFVKVDPQFDNLHSDPRLPEEAEAKSDAASADWNPCDVNRQMSPTGDSAHQDQQG
jgi:hypothetical protein